MPIRNAMHNMMVVIGAAWTNLCDWEISTLGHMMFGCVMLSVVAISMLTPPAPNILLFLLCMAELALSMSHRILGMQLVLDGQVQVLL